METTRKFVLGIAAVGAAAMVQAAPSDASAKEFYAGKTLTVLIGRSPGSGADTTARMFAKYWAQNIPGNPRIVAKKPGSFGDL